MSPSLAQVCYPSKKHSTPNHTSFDSRSLCVPFFTFFAIFQIFMVQNKATKPRLTRLKGNKNWQVKDLQDQWRCKKRGDRKGVLKNKAGIVYCRHCVYCWKLSTVVIIIAGVHMNSPVISKVCEYNIKELLNEENPQTDIPILQFRIVYNETKRIKGETIDHLWKLYKITMEIAFSKRVSRWAGIVKKNQTGMRIAKPNAMFANFLIDKWFDFAAALSGGSAHRRQASAQIIDHRTWRLSPRLPTNIHVRSHTVFRFSDYLLAE